MSTFFINPDYEYPGIDYEEYARIHEPLLLRGGVVAQFESYLVWVPALSIVTTSKAATEKCDVVLGRRHFYLADVPTDALEACSAIEPLTPLAQCADELPPGHHFLIADEEI